MTLTQGAIEWLRRHQEQQEAERAKVVRYLPGVAKPDLVFSRQDGSPYGLTYYSQHFALLLKKAGLPPIRLHDLRHLHATMLLEAGINPKVVSERLGHSTIVLTLDTYSHVLPTMQQQAVQVLDSVLDGAAPPAPSTTTRTRRAT